MEPFRHSVAAVSTMDVLAAADVAAHRANNGTPLHLWVSKDILARQVRL